MNGGASPQPRRGLVVSDLHLFARRSRGEACFQSLRADLASVDLLVLNGDIFDFRWSTLRNHDATVDAAASWLRKLAADFPRCEVHYVLGNHDCLTLFRERLSLLCSRHPRLHWHEHHLRLAAALFLHGDCAVRRMDLPALRAYRRAWEHDRQRGSLAATAYFVADRAGLTRLAHDWRFPRERTVARIARYLDHAQAGWRTQIRDAYFGHTHLAFSGQQQEGVTFHNTGSAIRGQEFKPIRFAIPAGNGARSGAN